MVKILTTLNSFAILFTFIESFNVSFIEFTLLTVGHKNLPRFIRMIFAVMRDDTVDFNSTIETVRALKDASTMLLLNMRCYQVIQLLRRRTIWTFPELDLIGSNAWCEQLFGLKSIDQFDMINHVFRPFFFTVS